ncbi:MAG: DUF4037 domain-containing protein [Sphaerochaetaceae bacterium]|nr:DUF4037 domain-containing protein [Sphaerochaetaceae bacterium]
MIETFVKAFFSREEVEAVVLSGSRTGLVSDGFSDYDVYIYGEKSVSLSFRRDLAEQFAEKAEVGNDFFGEGDELFLRDGTEVDLMYRSLSWAEGETERVWFHHQASVGYSTAFIHNLKTSRILYDPKGRFSTLQKQLDTPYPEELRDAIIQKNYPLLRSKLTASYYDQIEKAIKRSDAVSQVHRTAALLASYFDVLFAYNRQTHPGEKRLVSWAKQTCTILPLHFEKDLSLVTEGIGTNEILASLTRLLDHLDEMLGNSYSA